MGNWAHSNNDLNQKTGAVAHKKLVQFYKIYRNIGTFCIYRKLGKLNFKDSRNISPIFLKIELFKLNHPFLKWVNHSPH